MGLGVSMARRCPDQTKTEAARKAYVDKAIAAGSPKAVDAPAKRPASQMSTVDKLRRDEALRIAGGFVRGGHR